MILAVTLLISSTVAQAPAMQHPTAGDKTMALTAETWINALTLNLPETRTYVMLFFRSPRSPQATSADSTHRELEQLKAAVAQLNDLAASRKDILVLGLTTDSQEQIASLLSAMKPRFAIGLRSIAYRAFDVRQFPAVVVLRRAPAEPGQPDAWLAQPIDDVARLADEVGPAPEESDPAGSPLERLTDEELMNRLRSDPYDAAVRTTLEETLELLRIRMETDEFLRFCDEIEYTAGHDSRWVGSVRYQRHLADPAVIEKQSDRAASKDALASWRQSPDDPQWQSYRDFAARRDELTGATPEDILSLYRAHLGEDPGDLLVRHRFALLLASRRDPESLEPLKQMLRLETDPVIRSLIVLDISQTAPPGDPATLRLLEKELEGETNIRWTRPALELAIHWFREGTNNTE